MSSLICDRWWQSNLVTLDCQQGCPDVRGELVCSKTIPPPSESNRCVLVGWATSARQQVGSLGAMELGPALVTNTELWPGVVPAD